MKKDVIEDVVKLKDIFEKSDDGMLKAMLDNLPFMAWLKDKEGRFKVVNKAFEESCGKLSNEIIGYNDFEVWPEKYALKYMRDDNLVISTGHQLSVEEIIADKGEDVWVETFKTPIFDENKNVMGTIGISRDISERKKIEIDLQNQKRFLKVLMDEIPDLIFYKDTNSVYIGCNKAFAKAFIGKDEDEIVGKTDFDLVSNKELASFFRKKDMEMLGTGTTKINEESIELRDGTKVDIETIKTPFFDENGEVAGILGISRDITQRKKGENELNKKEKILTAVAASTKELLDNRNYFEAATKCLDILGNATQSDNVNLFQVEYSAEGKCYSNHRVSWFCNPSGFKYNMKEYQRIPYDFFNENLQMMFEEKAYCGLTSEITNSELRKELVSRNVHSTVVLPIIVRSNLWGFVGFEECKYDRIWTEGEFSTLSTFASSLGKAIERSLIEEELEQAKKAAETASISKGRFLANMSHEIRTPMNGILGFLDLLNNSQLSKIQKEYINEAKSASEILLYLINDILDFSKIEAGKLAMENIKLRLRDVVNDTISIMANRANEKKLKLKALISDDVPENVLGDPTRLKQVLNNLISNAIKFTDSGDILVTINCISRTKNYAEVRFEVRDTGIGISDNDTKNLFKPFTQADISTTRMYGGTGLGLSISNQLVKMMGGDIEVSSILGKGSSFYFTLKLELPIDNDTNDEYLSKEFTKKECFVSEIKDMSHPRILLVEDNEVNRKLFILMLRNKGLTCDIAVDGREAALACKRVEYDIVFMDCQMPVMDGFQSTSKIREDEGNRRHTFIIAMTASAMEGDRERCIKAGMDDYISKPIDYELIFEMINKYFSNKEIDSLDCLSLQESLTKVIDSTGIDEEVVKEIFNDFIDSLPELLESVDTAVSNKDFNMLSILGHKIKGMSWNLHIEGLSELSIELEKRALENEIEKCKELYYDMKKFLKRVKKFKK